MKKILGIVFLAGLVLAFSGTAMAKGKSSGNIEFGELSCQDFLEGAAKGDEASVAMILMWLDGYLSGVSGDTELNWEGFDTFSTSLAETCARSPKKMVLDVAKKVGLE